MKLKIKSNPIITIDITIPTMIAGPAISSSGISGGNVNNCLNKLMLSRFKY